MRSINSPHITLHYITLHYNKNDVYVCAYADKPIHFTSFNFLSPPRKAVCVFPEVKYIEYYYCCSSCCCCNFRFLISREQYNVFSF